MRYPVWIILQEGVISEDLSDLQGALTLSHEQNRSFIYLEKGFYIAFFDDQKKQLLLKEGRIASNFKASLYRMTELGERAGSSFDELNKMIEVGLCDTVLPVLFPETTITPILDGRPWRIELSIL